MRSGRGRERETDSAGGRSDRRAGKIHGKEFKEGCEGETRGRLCSCGRCVAISYGRSRAFFLCPRVCFRRGCWCGRMRVEDLLVSIVPVTFGLL